jgi:uncharacterized integral membrane protein
VPIITRLVFLFSKVPGRKFKERLCAFRINAAIGCFLLQIALLSHLVGINDERDFYRALTLL